MTDQHDKMLERIRALLAKAAGGTTDEEAELLRAKADELMTKYAIEMWQIEQAQGKRTERTTPIRKDIDISWWFDYTIDGEVRQTMYAIFSAVASHARCRVVGAHADYRVKTVPVIGMPSDIGYLDMLFTHLLLQMMNAMDPHPKPGEPFVDALVRMKEAGLKWAEIAKRLQAAGYYDDPKTPKTGYSQIYTDYCKRAGKDRTYTSPSIYRRSFVDGFRYELRLRLRNQEKEQGQNTGSNAIALRDIRDIVNEAMYLLFPDLRPHPEGCDCDVHHTCSDKNCKRPNCRLARSKRMPARMKEYAYDPSVVRRGQQAGREVTILSDAEQLRQTPRLGS